VAIGYRFVVEDRCAYVVWHGDVKPDQWNAHRDKFVNDPAYPDCPRSLVDMSSVGGIKDITDDVIREMAADWRERATGFGSLKWAIMPNGEWHRARRFEEEFESFPGIHTMLFNHSSTASTWLGINPAQTNEIIRELREELRARERERPEPN
jgi:hypothetical protein